MGTQSVETISNGITIANPAPAGLDKAIGVFTALFAMTYAASISAGYIAAGVLVLLLAWRFYLTRSFPGWKDFPLALPFLVYAGWGLVASLNGVGIARSLHQWRSDFIFLIFWILLFSFRLNPRARRWAVSAFAVGMAFMALSGLFQSAMFYWFPELNKSMVHSSIGVVRRFSLLEHHGWRVHGPINTMTFAEVMALGGLAMLGLWPGRFWLGTALGALCFAALFASGTRGPFLGMVAGMLTFIFGIVRLRRRLALRIFLPLAAACAILFISPSVWGRLKTAFHAEQNMDRLVMWRVGLNLLKDHPLTGVGISHVVTFWPKYFTDEWRKFFPYQQDLWSDVHNLYLQQAAERGIPGLAILLALLAAMIFSSWKMWRSKAHAVDGDISLCLVASLVAFLIMNITESALQDAEVIMTIYFLMALVWSGEERPAPPLRNSRPEPAASLVAI